MMKRALFATLMLIGIALSASAQKEEIFYYSDTKAESFVAREFIDRSAKTFYFDGDSEDDCVMEIKNYKKNGNTETFDIYVKQGPEKGKKNGSITIVTDPNLEVKKNEANLAKQTITIKSAGYTRKYYFMTEKQNNKFRGKHTNPIDKAKDKGNGLLDKGKGLFKKNKKE
jgi:hypothetical protein